MVRGPLMVQEKCLFYIATTANISVDGM